MIVAQAAANSPSVKESMSERLGNTINDLYYYSWLYYIIKF